MSLLRNFFVIDKIDTKTLKSILKSIEEINTFKVNTKDIFQIDVIGFQNIEVTLTRFDGERLGIVARFKVTKEHVLSTLLTTILWNQQKKTAHHIFAHTLFDNHCLLESHISCQDGVTKEQRLLWGYDMSSLLY